MSALLEVEELRAGYGSVPVLQGVSFAVAEGETAVMFGLNGAGKSTTVNTIAGLLRATGGDIRFDGNPISGLAAADIVKLGISVCPEGRRVFPRLKERRRQTAGTLSGGEQQMLAIGRAMMSRPRLLLLDEPSMGLAPLMVQKVFETVLAVSHEGVTILLVEQNAKLALEVSDRGYVMESGEITLAGKAADLLHDPKVRAAYLGEAA